MARLFSKEYHELSNTWYFKTKIFPFEKGELRYQAVEDEEGNLLIRFFAAAEKKKYLPEDLIIVYDPRELKILDHSCLNCSKEIGCNHYLTVIDYAYNYISTEIQKVEDTEPIIDSALKVDSSLSVFSKKLLEYSAYWQLLIINGKIHIEGIYNRDNDKIRFYFSGYKDIDLRLIAINNLNRSFPVRTMELGKRNQIKSGQSESGEISLIPEQTAAFKDSELGLLSLLQKIKCSYSKKHKYYTIYKKDFVSTFPYLQDLSSKVLIKETGERLIFSEDDYSLSLQVQRENEENYRIKAASGSFISAFYSGNESFIFIENVVNRLQLPFSDRILKQILEEGYLFPEEDLIFFASIAAKQAGMSKCYIDFASDIDLPPHYTSSPTVILKVAKGHNKEEQGMIRLYGGLIYQSDTISPQVLSEAGSETDVPTRGKEIPLSSIFFSTELVCFKSAAKVKEWFYIPYDKRVEVLNFLNILPYPDEDLMAGKSEYLYSSEEKKERLKKVLYENIPDDWILELDDSLKKEFVYRIELKPEVTIKPTDKIDWFEYEVIYKYQDLTFSHEELRKFFAAKEKYLKLEDNRLVYFTGKNKFSQLDKYLSHTRKQLKNRDLISNYNLSYLYILSELNEDMKIRGDTYLSKMYKELLRRHPEDTTPIPRALVNIMRSYQKAGFYWLKMLQKYKLGGLLADDMGLGKTLQSLAILSDYYENSHPVRKISLVICPKTLLYNWSMEIEKFHPNLTYTIYEGNPKERLPLLENTESDVIIVSYSLIQMDINHFMQRSYAYVILDEAQHIKNPLTLRSKGVKKLQVDHRLALTGTPIENSLIDIWSIFDFLMPGYLLSLRSFRKEYTEDEETAEKKKKRLSGIISPFILRRRKSEVLLELPDKQEQYVYNKMTPLQEKTYIKILALAKERLFSEKEEEIKSDYINILTALIRLRQTCNHPGLVDKELVAKENISGKMELLRELVQDAVENGRKILVFSQFAMMLKLIAGELDKIGLLYEYMDGKTSHRQQRIEHFTKNEKIRVFLLTLKVGGLGLNLTAADTVIIVDPWWNPMSENQSIDRVYRIGQTKKVLVYKIITKGTVEEKILKLQEQKRHVFKSVVEGSQSLIKKMSIEDIRNLFEYV